MPKIMTVDVLSSIKGAKPSETISKLFDVIKNATDASTNQNVINNKIVPLENLRDDLVISSSEMEKKIIIENFPIEKNGYLVVSKVIEE